MNWIEYVVIGIFIGFLIGIITAGLLRKELYED